MNKTKTVIHAALFSFAINAASATAAQDIIEGAKDAAVGIAGGASKAVGGAKKAVEPITEPVSEALSPVTDTVKPVTDIVTQSPESDRVKAQLAKPVDCNTAQHDIKVLEEEKASVIKRTVSGVRSVMPIGATISLLAGNYKDGVEVAVGDYNADIEARIQAITQTCNL